MSVVTAADVEAVYAGQRMGGTRTDSNDLPYTNAHERKFKIDEVSQLVTEKIEIMRCELFYPDGTLNHFSFAMLSEALN